MQNFSTLVIVLLISTFKCKKRFFVRRGKVNGIRSPLKVNGTVLVNGIKSPLTYKMGNLKKSTGNLMTEKKRGGSHKSPINLHGKNNEKSRTGLKQTYIRGLRKCAFSLLWTEGWMDRWIIAAQRQ